MKRTFAIVIFLSFFFSAFSADDRVKKLQSEINNLSKELELIKKTEAGVLGELRKLESERKLRETELEQILLMIMETEETMRQSEDTLSRTAEEIEKNKVLLRHALRQLYKLGKLRQYRLLLSAQSQQESLLFFRYASYFAEKNAKSITIFRDSVLRLKEERERLDAQREELIKKKDELSRRKKMLLQNESSTRTLLRSIQEKKEVHREAIGELKNACDELEKLVHSFGSDEIGADAFQLNARKFKGLFPWPCVGEKRASFGRIKHPKFGTELPHNGIDIDAPMGADIRAVFDGTVVFAEWFKGYGLTIILDHGSGILSISAHASAILVEKGEFVAKGTLIGKVGDSGSLSGAYLYFEIREDGRAVDPEQWLSER